MVRAAPADYNRAPMLLFTKAHQERLVELPDGTPVHCFNPRELRFLYDEIWRERVHLRNGIRIREGDCVLDVGAHVGLFSLLLTRLYRDLELYALEPVPALYGALLNNAQRHFPLARCIPAALAERDRRLLLSWFPLLGSFSTRHPDLDYLRNTVRTHCARADYPLLGPLARQLPQMFDLWTRPLYEEVRVEVEATTLSALIASEGITRIDLLKLDVEGSEVHVLRGIAARDWARIRQMVVKTTRADMDAVIYALREHGFLVRTGFSEGLRGTSYLYVYGVRPEAAHIRSGSV